MAQVILENIYKSFPRRSGAVEAAEAVSVLRRISLAVEDGEFMVLVGPSGCGKSTLLRLIAGLEEATGGTIMVGDRPVNDLPPKQRDIAMVFQSYALYPHMTVYENLAFGLRRSGVRGKGTPVSTGSQTGSQTGETGASNTPEWVKRMVVGMTRPLPKGLRYLSPLERIVDRRVHEVAQMLQIEELLDRLPKQLSGGQKQRVALGRAMARNPQVFLMDEPLSNLDAKLRTETRAQIVALQRKLGITTIYVTHDQTEAMTMGDRIVVLNAGQIQQIATPLELYNHPANQFVAEFIGSPPMNFLTVQVQGALLISHALFRMTLPEVWETGLKAYSGKSLILGIRPEHFSISLPAPKNLPVVVERIEALGSETYLTVAPKGTPDEPRLLLRTEPDRPVAVGEELWLSLAPDKLHLFDPETGTALSPHSTTSHR